jgi:hypothetical protein
MKADRALELGFVDSIEQMSSEHEPAMYAMLDKFKNTPSALRDRPHKTSQRLTQMAMRCTKQLNRGATLKSA